MRVLVIGCQTKVGWRNHGEVDMKVCGRMVGRAAILLLIAIVANACAQTRPLYKVENESIAQHSPPLSLKQIESRILAAGWTTKWRLRARKSGQIQGSLIWGSYSAIVTIDYDQRFYSIRYKSSNRLQAGNASKNDPRTGKFLIHNRYNSGVRTLQETINLELRFPRRKQ